MARLGSGAALALLVALAAAAAYLAAPASAGVPDAGALEVLAVVGGRPRHRQCSGAVGECGVDEDEELGLGGDGDGALLRRALAQRQPRNRYISYAALRADQVPCNRRGRSYYSNCASQQPANPYRRGCSAITRCARTTN